jgi:hypothetical protein
LKEMKIETYERLRDLHGRYGAQEFGKLCQKLLAISFGMAGYGHVVERGVQGVDVDAGEENGQRYAVEVKTTTKESVQFEQKDAEGLENRRKDGYQPLLAVLRLFLFSEWYFVKADRLKPGGILLDSLRPYRLRILEDRIKPCFDQAVDEHFNGAFERAQAYLDGVLREKGIDAQS